MHEAQIQQYMRFAESPWWTRMVPDKVLNWLLRVSRTKKKEWRKPLCRPASRISVEKSRKRPPPSLYPPRIVRIGRGPFNVEMPYYAIPIFIERQTILPPAIQEEGIVVAPSVYTDVVYRVPTHYTAMFKWAYFFLYDDDYDTISWNLDQTGGTAYIRQGNYFEPPFLPEADVTWSPPSYRIKPYFDPFFDLNLELGEGQTLSVRFYNYAPVERKVVYTVFGWKKVMGYMDDWEKF